MKPHFNWQRASDEATFYSLPLFILFHEVKGSSVQMDLCPKMCPSNGANL